jgi:predicted AlkP superfamily phosphohydrolase/phosphomutase
MGHVGQIYLNVAGREPHGFITKDTYQETRQQVISALQELTGSDGHPLVSKIILREESYHGPYAEKGPDLHLVLDDYRAIAFPLFATNGQIITNQIRGDSGCHRREGIFIASGPDIQGESPIPAANIIDLAPTILHLLGQPVPRMMDGRVLTQICSSSRDVTYIDEGDLDDPLESKGALSDEETAQVEERLRSLGYL